MEALVILLGEFLFSLFGGIVLVFSEAVLLVFTSIASFIIPSLKRPLSAEETVAEQPKANKSSPGQKVRNAKAITMVRWGIAGVAILTVAGVVLVNTLLFEGTLKHLAKVVSNRTEIEISFSSAEGSFLPGQVALHDAVIRSKNRDKSSFEITVQKISVDFSLFSLLGRCTEVDELAIEGMEGSFKRLSNPAADTGRADSDELKARKSFVIHSLGIDDSSMRILGSTEGEAGLLVPVTIKHLRARPLRSTHAVFDVFFRTNAEGTISGNPFELKTKAVSDGRSTEWHFNDLPVSLLSHFVGGPFKLFVQGTVDVSVRDDWQLGNETEIDTHWDLTLKNAEAAVPADAGQWAASLGQPIADYINRQEGPLPFSFGFTLNEDEFKGVASLETAGLWNVFSNVFVNELASRLDISKEDIKDGISSGYGRFKDFLDEKRGSKDSL